MKMRCITFLMFISCSIQTSERIVALSIPKSGSFLLYKCIQLITGKQAMHEHHAVDFTQWDEGFVTNHELPVQDAVVGYQKQNIKAVLIYRDPRDQVVSTAHFVKEYLKRPKAIAMDHVSLISDCIINTCQWWDYVVFQGCLPINLSITSLYEEMLSWQKYSFVYGTTFEKLVGPKGGGNQEEQLQEIKNIAAHIGHEITHERAIEIADKLFGRFTFRQGQIGAWKDEFTPGHKELFKQHAGQLLIDLGYEKDLNW